MKLVTSLVMILAATTLATTAIASPKVGDYAEFILTASKGNQSMKGAMNRAIVSENGDKMTVLTNIQFEGQAQQAEQVEQNKADLVSTELVNDVLAKCAQYGGSAAQVTVPAGSFNTCKLPFQDEAGKVVGYNWVAGVPFGIVKYTELSSDGITYTLDLTKFTFGK